MGNNFITYQKFNDFGLAQTIAQELKESEIEYLLVDNSKYFDVSFANNSFESKIDLKVKSEDFIKADKALDDLYKKNLEEVEKDYYLFSFSEDELNEIISKPDEWGNFDYQLALKILREKGKGINPEEIELLKFRRVNELAEPETTNDLSIVLGYIISIIGGFFTILGGFIGILIGWALVYLKKTLPDGQIVYSYKEETRKQGKILLIFSSIITVFWYIVRLYFLRR